MTVTSVDHESRTVTIGDHIFRLSPKGPGAWDVFEGDKHFGWFAIGAKKDRHWLIANYEAFERYIRVDAGLVARLWLDSFDDSGDPRP